MHANLFTIKRKRNEWDRRVRAKVEGVYSHRYAGVWREDPRLVGENAGWRRGIKWLDGSGA